MRTGLELREKVLHYQLDFPGAVVIHSSRRTIDILLTCKVSRTLLDEGFILFGIEGLDPEGKIRQWLASRYTPEAIRQGLAIFGTELNKGRLQNQTALGVSSRWFKVVRKRSVFGNRKSFYGNLPKPSVRGGFKNLKLSISC